MTDLNALAERLERRAASFDAEGLKHRQALETCHGSFASDFAGWASHAEANAALDRQAAQALRGMGWQDMATAPMDGTPILISRPTVFPVEEGWHVVRWDEHPYISDRSAWICHDGKNDTPLRGPDPEIWMPLPDARSALKG